MKQRIPRLWSLSLLFLLPTLVTIVFLYYGTPHFDFTTALASIAEQQHLNSSLASLRTYRQASRLASSPKDFLSLLKRLHQYPLQEDYLAYLKEISQRAHKKFPDSQPLRAYAISALIDNGEVKEAYPLLVDLNSHYNNLKAELLLKLLQKEQNQEEDSIKNILNTTDAETVYEIARWMQQPKLLYNSLLAFLSEDQLDRAREVAKSLANYPFLPQYFMGLLAYDEGNFEKAITHFLIDIDKQKTDIDYSYYWLIGDSYISLKKYNEAIFYYRQALKSKKDWHLYYNLATAHVTLDDNLSAFQALNNGLQRFPSEEHLIQRFVYLAHEKNPQAAQRLINDFRNEYDSSPQVELLSLMLNSDGYQDDLYLSKMWQLFNYYPDDPLIAEYLVWYLLGLNYRQQSAIAIERIENHLGTVPTWLLSYKGMLFLLDQRFEDAYNMLSAAFVQNKRPDILYNIALVQKRLGKDEEAAQTLRLAWTFQPQQKGLFLSLARELRLDEPLLLAYPDRASASTQNKKDDLLLDFMEGLLQDDYIKNSAADRKNPPSSKDS